MAAVMLGVVQASVEEAAPEMRRAAMCVCLPDATLWQEVVCMTQAVLSGCIPVTFFHDHLHPWLGTFHFRCPPLPSPPLLLYPLCCWQALALFPCTYPPLAPLLQGVLRAS